MADSSPLADLLDRASKVFSLAGNLGRAFHEEHRGQRRQSDAGGWNCHATKFNEFYEILLDLRDAMQNPPDGFAPVAESLLEAARIAKSIRDAMQRSDGLIWSPYLEFFPRLNSTCENGWRAVKEVTEARRLDDPLAFVDQPSGGGGASVAFSLLDRYPATQAGHVSFLEFVRDEVHNAAEAKRKQLAEKYSNATIESMVRGIKWAEARTRLTALADLPEGVRANIGDILHRELTAGTVEQIDALLQPAVWGVRDSLEQARLAALAGKVVVVNTAGDLWKALAEGYQPRYQASAVSIRPALHTPSVTCPNPTDEAGRLTLDRALALVTLEGGDRATAMEKLIARIQVQKGLDKASVIRMPLADFVVACTAGSAKRSSGTVGTFSAHALAAMVGGSVNRSPDIPSPTMPANMPMPMWPANAPMKTAPKTAAPNSTASRSKRSTERGEGRIKLIAALTKHHKYDEGSCLNLEHIGNNKLAELAGVSTSTASDFFNWAFNNSEKGGHAKYRAKCQNAGALADALKLLRGEFTPAELSQVTLEAFEAGKRLSDEE